MALPTTGQISISDICVELGLAPTTNISLNDIRFRKLAKKETDGSTISMSDFHGKSNFDYEIGITKGAVEFLPPQSNNLPYPAFGLSTCVYIKSLTPGVYLQGVTGYNANGSVLFDDTRNAAKSGSWSVGAPAEPVYPGSSDGLSPEQKGQIFVFHYIAGRKVNVNIYRLVVRDTNGNEYELSKHRNIAFQSGPNGLVPASQFGKPDSVTKTPIAPNYP